MPFIGAFSRDLLTLALCSTSRVGAAHAPVMLRFLGQVFDRGGGAWGCVGHALCSCTTQTFDEVGVEVRLKSRRFSSLYRRAGYSKALSVRGGRDGSASVAVHADRRHRKVDPHNEPAVGTELYFQTGFVGSDDRTDN
jgi:hypothetical protein